MRRKRLPVPLEKLTEAQKITLIRNLRERLDAEKRKGVELLSGMRVRLDAVEWALARAHVEVQARRAGQEAGQE